MEEEGVDRIADGKAGGELEGSEGGWASEVWCAVRGSAPTEQRSILGPQPST